MLNRLAILLLLTLSSVAIPMQEEVNYQTRVIQSQGLESCIKNIDQNLVIDDIVNKEIESSINKINCNN
jgi:hypothetical protein